MLSLKFNSKKKGRNWVAYEVGYDELSSYDHTLAFWIDPFPWYKWNTEEMLQVKKQRWSLVNENQAAWTRNSLLMVISSSHKKCLKISTTRKCSQQKFKIYLNEEDLERSSVWENPTIVF